MRHPAASPPPQVAPVSPMIARVQIYLTTSPGGTP
jgi:hypothetical protein